MTTPSPISHEVITINYTLSWPHLHHPSNTTFAGITQLDICTCGSAPGQTDHGHLYTRYRCARPLIKFASPDEGLWVLHAPLGQVNLLRPALPDELQRRREIYGDAHPAAYAGKNFLLLTGPCPRGRYQAYATCAYLRSLTPEARQAVECISLLIQPYEEDHANDQGDRAYVELARYILEELPAFTTLCLNIWGEETKYSSREFAMVLWREGVKILVTWNWWSDKTEEYTEVEDFMRGIEVGSVGQRSPWEGLKCENDEDDGVNDGDAHTQLSLTIVDGDSQKPSRETSIFNGRTGEKALWEEVPAHEYQEEQDDIVDNSDSQTASPQSEDPKQDQRLSAVSSDGDWTDAILTPSSAGTESTGGESAWYRV